MADDDLDEEFDPDAIEEELDEEVPADEEFVDEDALVDDDALAAAALVPDDPDAPTDGTTDPVGTKRAGGKREDDDEEEDDFNEDDVEADLSIILKDKIAATEEEDLDDEEELVAPRAVAEPPDGVVPKKANEFVCTGCFLLVNAAQFGPPDAPQCPVGESVCPGIGQLRRLVAVPARPPAAKKAPAKATRKTSKPTGVKKAPAKTAKKR